MWREDQLRTLAWRTGEGLAGASLLIALLYGLHANFATAGFLQMLIVLGVALRGGFWPATVVSVFANVGLNFFFVPPVLAFTVADWQNGVALVVFEVTAVLVSRLSARSQEQAVRAVRGRREIERLYRVSHKMLMLGQESTPAEQIAVILREVFDAKTVVLFDRLENRLTCVGMSDALLEPEVRGAAILKEDIRSATPETVIRLLNFGPQVVGALGLRGCHMTPVTADAMANLAAIGLERARDRERIGLLAAANQASLTKAVTSSTVVRVPPCESSESKKASAFD